MDNYFDLWFGHQRTMLPQYLDFARAFRPHLLVCDLLEYSAPVIGALLGVPVVRHRWSVDFLTGFVRPQARTALHDTCRELGLDALPDPTLVLDPCPPTLQLPDAEPGTPIRAVPFNGNGQLPEWRRQEWGPSGRYAGWPCPGPAHAPAQRGAARPPHPAGLRGLADTEAVATVEPEFHEAVGPLLDQRADDRPDPPAPAVRRLRRGRPPRRRGNHHDLDRLRPAAAGPAAARRHVRHRRAARRPRGGRHRPRGCPAGRPRGVAQGTRHRARRAWPHGCGPGAACRDGTDAHPAQVVGDLERLV